mmetsp:Transcript_17949/g.42455  ORF Transcript_17949/g.42455 Transcript_17949/m.42455 type:complete len:259 (-) Transcript_17949:355-1131(-)
MIHDERLCVSGDKHGADGLDAVQMDNQKMDSILRPEWERDDVQRAAAVMRGPYPRALRPRPSRNPRDDGQGLEDPQPWEVPGRISTSRRVRAIALSVASPAACPVGPPPSVPPVAQISAQPAAPPPSASLPILRLLLPPIHVSPAAQISSETRSPKCSSSSAGVGLGVTSTPACAGDDSLGVSWRAWFWPFLFFGWLLSPGAGRAASVAVLQRVGRGIVRARGGCGRPVLPALTPLLRHCPSVCYLFLLFCGIVTIRS